MLDFMFFLKTLLVTFVLVALLQIKWNSVTLEDQATEFIHSSSLMVPLQKVAQSGTLTLQKGLSWMSHQVNQRFIKPGNKIKDFQFQRSTEYQDILEQKKATPPSNGEAAEP